MVHGQNLLCSDQIAIAVFVRAGSKDAAAVEPLAVWGHPAVIEALSGHESACGQVIEAVAAIITVAEGQPFEDGVPVLVQYVIEGLSVGACIAVAEIGVAVCGGEGRKIVIAIRRGGGNSKRTRPCAS